MDIILPARDEKGRIMPGHSLNPQGRPTLPAEVRSVLQAGSQRAAEKLVELVESSDPRVAAAAATAVLDRLFGRPAQAVDANIRQEQVDVGRAHLKVLMELQERREVRLAHEKAMAERG